MHHALAATVAPIAPVVADAVRRSGAAAGMDGFARAMSCGGPLIGTKLRAYVDEHGAGWLVEALVERQDRPRLAGASEQVWTAGTGPDGTVLRCADDCDTQLLLVRMKGFDRRLDRRCRIRLSRAGEGVGGFLYLELAA